MIDLTNEDCFEYLSNVPDKAIDLVLTDPPYQISRDTNFASGNPTGRDTDRFRVSMDFGDWDKAVPNLMKVIQECYRVLRIGGTMICFYDLWKITLMKNYFDEAGFKQLRFIEWLKTNPVPLNSKTNYLTNVREVAIVGVKGGKPTFHSEYDDGIYRYPICHDKGRFHTAQKPVALMEELILKHTNPEDLVLDCFAGSASTAIAALHTNRHFIGCEISTEYYIKAMERIKEETDGEEKDGSREFSEESQGAEQL